MGILDDSHQTLSSSEEEDSSCSYSQSNTSYDDEETTLDPNQKQISAPMKDLHMVEIAKLTYRDFIIGIFKSKGSIHNRFFFEPIVQLDPTSIITTQTNSFQYTHQDAVRFKILMWNQELRSKVLDRLRSLPSLKNVEIQEDDVHVMPYKEVQLNIKKASLHHKIKLMNGNQPISYHRLSEGLDFYFLCDDSSMADQLAVDFRRNPAFLLKSWQLSLKCSGLALANRKNPVEMTSLESSAVNFNVTTFRRETAVDKLKGLVNHLLSGLFTYREPLLVIFGICFLFLFCFTILRLMLSLDTLSVSMKPNSNGMPTSCKDLQILGHTLNGFYSVKNSQRTKMETIYCDFQTDSKGKGLEARIGVVDVKSLLVQFSVEGHGNYGITEQKIAFEKQALNIGNGFDWENQLFRAPNPGTYFFSVSGTKDFGVPNSSRAAVSVLVNGETIGEAVSSDKTDFGGFSYQVVRKLSANDKVELFMKFGKVYSLYFNGWMLDEDLIF